MKKYFFLTVFIIFTILLISFISADNYRCYEDGQATQYTYETLSDCNWECSYAEEWGAEWECQLIENDAPIDPCNGEPAVDYTCWENYGSNGHSTSGFDCLVECEDFCWESYYDNTCVVSGSPNPYLAGNDCGNGICDSGEDEDNCPGDCDSSSGSGIVEGGSCVYAGEFNSTHYCDFDKTLKTKLDSGSCDNDYECSTGSCMEGNCQEKFKEVREHTNWLQSILDRILALFTGTQCVPGTDGPRTCFNEDAVGICQNGQKTCENNGKWSECVSTILPGQITEICDNNQDDDCDGIDDSEEEICMLECDTIGASQSCGTNEGECRMGQQYCNASYMWTPCGGYNYIGPAEEICSGGLDEDCDGLVDYDDEESCGQCEPGIQRVCGNNTGECVEGIQTCDETRYWGECEGDYQGATNEICNDVASLDEDCDGFSNLEDLNSCDVCEGTPAIDCTTHSSNFTECAATFGCSVDYDNQLCENLPCDTWGAEELSCMSAGCDWQGSVTIYCGNYEIDEILNEECDLTDLNELNCLTYGSQFSGGSLDCVLPGLENQCTFDTTYCTITVMAPPTSNQNISLSSVNGLPEFTTATFGLGINVPDYVLQPDNSTFLGRFTITVSKQPLDGSEIFFQVNKSIVNNSNNVGVWEVIEPNDPIDRTSEDDNLTSLATEYVGETDLYYNYSANTDNFSTFLVFEEEPYCGNDRAEAVNNEECDGNDLNGNTCRNLGFDTGALTCDDSCYLNLSDCSYAGTGEGGDNSGAGSGDDSYSQMNIVVFSPKTDITYGKLNIPLQVIDSLGNAGFWRYSLNSETKNIFSPNTTIVAQTGTNVLKIYAKEEAIDTYEVRKILSFNVVDNPNGYCGDLICGEGEDCGSCGSDCGSCALLDGYCGDLICGDGENKDNCSIDCKADVNEGKSKTWLFIIIILVILVGMGIVVYLIYNKSKGKNLTQPPIQKPTTYRPSSNYNPSRNYRRY